VVGVLFDLKGTANMKRCLLIAFTVVLCVASIGTQPSVAVPQAWQPVSGPMGGSVAALAMSPDYVHDHTVFAGIRDRGVYRTTDRGESWQASGLPGQVVYDLAISPAYAADRTLFAVVGFWTDGFNVYRSNDGGATWQPPYVTPASFGFSSIDHLSISPDFAHDHTMYVFGSSGVYCTNDGGQVFFRSTGWLGSHEVTQLAFSPNYAVDHTLFAAVWNDRLYKSTNGGAAWSPTGLSGTLSALAVSPNYASDQKVAGVSHDDGRLFLSTDRGTTWLTGTLTLDTYGQPTLLFSGDLMFAASSSELAAYRSSDGGTTWSPVGGYDPAHAYQGGFRGGSIFALASSPTNDEPYAFAGTSSGIYRSTNLGQNWYQSNQGMPRLTVRSLAVAPNDPLTLLAGTSYFEHVRFDAPMHIEADGNVQLSTDGGVTWQAVSGPLDRVTQVIFSPDFAHDRTAFASSGISAQHGYSSHGTFRSTDGGNTWSEVLNTACEALALSPNFAADHTAWVCGVWRTTDGGDTWIRLTDPLGIGTTIPSPNYAVDQTLFASAYNGLLKSIDGGQHWTRVLGDTITAFALTPAYAANQTLYAGIKEADNAPGEIQRSLDGGTTWQPLSTGIPAASNGQPVNIAALDFAADGSVLVGVTYGTSYSGAEVYRSIDGGQAWQSLGSDLNAFTLFDLTSSSNEVEDSLHGAVSFYAGTSGGLWRSDRSQRDPTEPGAWESSGPRGGRAQVLAVSPDFANDGLVFSSDWVYTRHQLPGGRGIFKSVDWGQTWQSASQGLDGGSYPSIPAVQGFAFSPEFAVDKTILIATNAGLFKSTDRGVNWQRLTRSDASIRYSAVAVAPNFPASGHALAADFYGTLYASHDHGANWSSSSLTAGVSLIAYSPAFASDGTVFAGGAGVYVTYDSGAHWTTTLSAAVSALAVSPQFNMDRTIFAGSDVLYRSTNGGLTWITTTIGMSNTRISALALSPQFVLDHTLYAGTNVGLFRSDDGGAVWNSVSEFVNVPVLSLAISPGWPTHPYLLVGTASGMSRSNDGGATWMRMSGLALLDASPIALSPDEGLWLTGSFNGVHASADNGHTWQPFGLQPSVWYVSALTFSPDYTNDHTIFEAQNNNAGLGAMINRTTDGGVTWQYLYGQDAIHSLAISPQYATDHTLYTTGDNQRKVWRSNDRGDHWTEVGSWSLSPSRGVRLVALPPDYPTDETIFAAGSGFWRLPPGATSWQPVATGSLSNTVLVEFAVAPDYAASQTLLAAGWQWSLDDQVHYDVFRSDDGGVNWQPSGTGVTDRELRDVAFSPNYASDHTAYLISAYQLYRSIDGGHSWTAIGAPPGWPTLNRMVVDHAGRVLVTSSSGVWQYRTGFHDILSNGDFEAEGGWALTTGATRTPSVVFNGRQALRLGLPQGNPGVIDSGAIQTMTIPLSATLAQLNLRVYPVTSETQPNSDAQYATVSLSGTVSVSSTLFWMLSNAQAWQPYSFDLTSFAGETIVLRLGVLNDGLGGQTAIYVDNASLITLGPSGKRVYLPVILKNDAN
jgi:photosystem II stability/assembly factor-like uncharacterized protein